MLRHDPDPTLEDTELADRLTAQVLVQRRSSQQRKPYDKYAP